MAEGKRRTPRQERSRQLVAAVREAGRLILEEAGPSGLTMTGVARRAGVSVGSLYQYFESKDAVLAAIYSEQADLEAEDLAGLPEELVRSSPREGVRLAIRAAVARHRRMLELHPDYYREHHRDFRVGDRLPVESEADVDRAVDLARSLLEARADGLRQLDLEIAAWIVGRGVPALLRAAVEERPELLSNEAFTKEVVDLLSGYLFPPE